MNGPADPLRTSGPVRTSEPVRTSGPVRLVATVQLSATAGPPAPARHSATARLFVVSVLGLLLTVLIVLIGAGPAAAALSRTLPRAAPAGTTPVRIEIDTVTPAALPPTGTLVVQGRITNTGTTALNHVYLRLRYRYETLEKRADLQRWASGDETLTRSANEPRDADETGKYRKTLKAPLPAHGGASFRLAVPAAKLGLPDNAAAFGSRGLIVETFADIPGAGPEQVGAACTFVVWDPKPVRQPTRLTLLAPVTSALPQGDASEPGPGLMASMTPDERLGRLATTIQRSGISWAIDPALLAAATRAQNPTDTPATKPGSTPTATPSVRPGPDSTSPDSTSPDSTSTPGATGSPATMVAGASSPSDGDPTSPGTTSPGTTSPGQDGETTSDGAAGVAASWLGGVRRTAATNPPLVLPFGDPDLTALAHNDGAGLLELARNQADATTKQVFGTSPRSSVAWPADGQADAATIDTLTGPSWQGVILVASSQPPTTAQVVTPSARSTVSRQGTPLAGLLCDEGLSALLAQLGKAGTGATEIALIQQRLLAELAAITAERPAESRHLLAVAPRDWDPDPLAVERALTVLRQVPWIQLQSVDALLAQRPSPVKRPDLHYPGQALAAELPKDIIDWVVHKERALEAFAPVLTVPQLVVPELQRRMVSLTSVAWRGRSRAELVTARAPVQERLYAILGAVTGAARKFGDHAVPLRQLADHRTEQARPAGPGAVGAQAQVQTARGGQPQAVRDRCPGQPHRCGPVPRRGQRGCLGRSQLVDRPEGRRADSPGAATGPGAQQLGDDRPQHRRRRARPAGAGRTGPQHPARAQAVAPGERTRP